MKIINFSSISSIEKGYLFGLFAGDGYRFHEIKQRHFTVEFFLHSQRDKKIQEYLTFLLKKLGMNPIIYKDKRYECNRTRVYSKQFFGFINRNFKIIDRDFKIGFISGMIDAEGNVNSKKSFIKVANTDRKLLLKVKRYLCDLGIKSTLSTRKYSDKNWSDLHSLNISNAFINIKNNSLKVNSGVKP
jgi:hypothetical protein